MKTWQTSKVLRLFPVLALSFGALSPLSASASIVEECVDDFCTITFGYTGATESLTFPSSATNIRFDVFGAQGGKTGGAGGRVTGVFLENPSTIFITVGGAGQSSASAPGGFNGGGTAGANSGLEGSGGGASDIRVGPELSSRIVVAGGGGGRGSGLGAGGGAGGSLVGAAGKTGQGGGGTGGTQEAGGIGGLPNGEGIAGTQGELGVGGAGGSGPLHGGGGGGGGYFGGGGGGPDADWCCNDAGGGGGGSSYTDPAAVTEVVHYQGVRQGSGQIVISYQLGIASEPELPAGDLEAPPTQEPVTTPTDEPTPKPTPEEPVTTPTDEPTPKPTPEEPVISSPKDFESSDKKQFKPETSEPELSPPENNQSEPDLAPLPIQEPIQERTSPEILWEPIGEIETPPTSALTLGVSPSRDANSSGAELSDTPRNQEVFGEDQILQLPSDLSQAAQTVVVPAQSRAKPFSPETLLAGLIAVAILALIAGLVVARKGVPGAIAS